VTLRYPTNVFEVSESSITLFNEVCSEPGKQTLANWAVKLPSVTDGYKVKDTANCHETGLLFFLSRNVSLKGENIVVENSAEDSENCLMWFYSWREGET
jgi:hypothetical protein